MRKSVQPRALPLIALTTGEPAGIGPDLALMLAARPAARRGARLVLVGDAQMLARRATRLGLKVTLRSCAGLAACAAPGPGVAVLHVPLAHPAHPGHLDARNAAYVLGTLDAALAGCVSGVFAAMVTAPVHKGVINEAGIAFTGHTEYLAEKTHTLRVVMMLAGGRPPLRVALATTHLALKDVPRALTREDLRTTLTILEADLRGKFGIARPRIVVAGLNPHAGESGHMGREEIEVITPVLEELRKRGMRLTGPLPADTLFTPRVLAGADAVLAMYHDQGLPVLKYATFGEGINITLGLPIIRTSVDHGTALDLAATPAKAKTADPGSLITAFRLAVDLATRAAPAKRKAPARRSKS
ncbi:MAG: 4-hydroxythreonine-4-phosphate dehydrogenase [Betaproteobacteria bacterium]|nr:4-hydroxythreonine-4-phosphate dehydrogenase [Betaproteobacteria bacterium]